MMAKVRLSTRVLACFPDNSKALFGKAQIVDSIDDVPFQSLYKSLNFMFPNNTVLFTIESV